MSRFLVVPLIACGIGAFNLPLSAEPKKIDFDREIRPILSENCFTCHGPDEKKRMANLRLDTKDGAFADRNGHPVIVPGKSADSKLFQRVGAPEKAKRMPPPTALTQLTAAQVDLIRQWIDQGANWEQHWAYVPPKRPDVPPADKTWARNPIDNFILARLQKEGWKPSPEADKATLLRRVTFDLTGLPPTTAEVDAFVADQAPDAYEKVVDRLLASPHYGERMAMQWLDLARYADTHGYHIDSHRDMWHWRDWVIASYNRNLPFDKFALYQLAGDLLPNSTVDQRIATGFSRNHMINFEGGAIPEEYQTEYVIDRVDTTSTVFLGMTMGCARCHDHKYDPIKQKDFYRFFAFFNSIPEKGLDGRAGNAAPVMQLPTPEEKRDLEEVKAGIAANEQALPKKEVESLQTAWESSWAQLPEPPRNGLLAHYEFDGGLSDSSGGYQHARVVNGDLTFGEGAVVKSASFDGETNVDFGNVGQFDKTKPIAISFWLKGGGSKLGEMEILQKIDPAKGRRGWEIAYNESVPIGDLKRGSNLIVRLISNWPSDAIEVQTKDRLATGEWYHFAVQYDGSGKASGISLQVNGKQTPLEIAKDTLTGPLQTAATLQVGNKKLGAALKAGMDDLRIYDRLLDPKEVQTLAIHLPVRAILSGVGGVKRSKDQTERVRDYFLTYGAPEEFREHYASLKALKHRKEMLDKTIATTMVMAEMEKPRDSFVLARGDYRNHGEKVTPGVPMFLPPLPKDAPANRLGLAKWIVDPSNPLTSRVAVNRFWQMYFGAGIVKTAEDFGSQGEQPVHPELLDWLATEFVGSGWDVKAMQRLIVTSATYRQSSRETPEMREKDPENRLLARGPRYRLPAEMVRDNALSVAGLINGKIGGASVFPYQPKGLWEETAFGDVYSAQSYSPSHGDDLYRRSMYTFWKRTSPPPSLITFDAPDREKCTARRAVTNTPLQALVLLNDPTYVEAARALAQKMIDNGRDPASRIKLGFRLATARQPDSRELQVLRDLARTETASYSQDKADAEKLVHVGESPINAKVDKRELAAWTTVASVILNLDETITKE